MTTTDTWELLSGAIAAGDEDGVLSVLEPLTERQRQRLRKGVVALAKDIAAASRARALSEPVKGGLDPKFIWPAFRLAEFGTNGAAAVAKSSWGPLTARHERLLRARDRAWRQRVVDTRSRSWRGIPWPSVYTLARDGLVDRPDHGWYIAEAVGHKDLWRDDRAWLEEDFWRFFEVEEAALELSRLTGYVLATAGNPAFTGMDEWSPVTWFVELSVAGSVPRARVLDEALGALRRDFALRARRFYRELFVALEPSDDELAERLDDLLALLASDDVADIAFALRRLEILDGASRLPGAPLLEALGPVLDVPVKAHALAAVRLAGSLLDRAPGDAALGLPVLIEALAHEKPAVQKAAFAVIKRHAAALRPADRERLRELQPDVDPGLRCAVAELAGVAPSASPRLRAVEVPARRPVDRTAPRLDAIEALKSIETAGELSERAENRAAYQDPDEIELIHDALLRFPAHTLDPARVNPFDVLRHALNMILEPRRTSETGQIPSTGEGPREAILVRMRELLDPGRPWHRLLSAPTHRGGWIDPREAVRRVAGLPGPASAMDLAQMVLRLAPDGRAQARDAAARLDGEEAAVLRRALGGDVAPPHGPGRLAPAWAAAEDARDPDAHDLGADGFGDRDARDRGLWMRERPILAPANPADLLDLEEVWWHDFYERKRRTEVECWLMTVWPANRESCYRLVSRRLWCPTHENDAWGLDDILALLLDPREPAGPHALLAIGMALGAKDVGLRALAVDVALAVLANRRADGVALGAALGQILRRHRFVEPEHGLPGGRHGVVPQRWVAPLTDIARSSALGAHDAQAAIEAVLAAAGDDDRRQLSGLVGLLRQLALEADAAVTDAGARDWLGRYSPRTAGGATAGEILAVGGDGAARSHAARELVQRG